MKNYWIMGDIHGDYLPVRNFYIHHKNELSDNPDDNVLILLGDVSANYFFNERDNQFKNIHIGILKIVLMEPFMLKMLIRIFYIH